MKAMRLKKERMKVERVKVERVMVKRVKEERVMVKRMAAQSAVAATKYPPPRYSLQLCGKFLTQIRL
jgi:hypothetical protein